MVVLLLSHGEAKGKVKIVHGVKDLSKVEAGDVLVSVNAFEGIVLKIK